MNGDVCCMQGGCANQCVPDCRLGGSCPTNLTCDESTGVCLPPGMTAGTAGSSSASATGGNGPTSGSGPATATGGVGPASSSNGPTGGNGPTAGNGPTGATGGRGPTGGNGPAAATGSSGGGIGGTSSGSSSGSSSGQGGNAMTCQSAAWDAGTSGGGSCTSSADCAVPTLACDSSSQSCVQCLLDDDCPAGEGCDTSTNTCSTTSICTYGAAAYPTGAVNANGCRVMEIDTCSCLDARLDAGITGAFLKFSCRLSITKVQGIGMEAVQILSDSVPGRHDKYFESSEACYEVDDTTTYPDPYTVIAQGIDMQIPLTVTTEGSTAVPGGIMGLAVDGVSLFNDSAGPGVSIWTEAGSFERCHGHPNSTGVYHYHMEPYSITQDDDSLVGVMRDGYFVYGRRDPDGTEAGSPDGGVTYPYYGHVGYTVDSPEVPVFHYHVHFENIDGGTGYFVAPAEFYGTMAPCTNQPDGGSSSHC